MTESVERKYPHPDLSLLKEMAEGDDDFIKEIITLFLKHGPIILASIEEAAAAADYNTLRLNAHKLLSDLSILGIKSAIKNVEIIEKQAAQKIISTQKIKSVTEAISLGIEDLKQMINYEDTSL